MLFMHKSHNFSIADAMQSFPWEYLSFSKPEHCLLDSHEIDRHPEQTHFKTAAHNMRRPLQHDQANTTHVLGAGVRLGVDATGEWCSAVVVEVVVKRTVAGTKSLFLEKERVI